MGEQDGATREQAAEVPADAVVEASVPSLSADEIARRRREAWRRVFRGIGRGATVAGQAAAKGAVWTAQQLAAGYQAIDPDLRRHLVQAPVVGVTHLFPHDDAVVALPDDGHPILVFVHGLGGHPGDFLMMRRFLAFMGRTRSYAIRLPAGARVPELAERLRAYVAEVRAANGAPEARVDIVAHSRGGLVTRMALLDPAFAAGVSSVVTLGTPHSGTYLARLAATGQTLDLRPDSPVIQALETQIPWGRQDGAPRLVAFWSEADMLLHPPESARVEGAENVRLAGYTHLSYLLNPVCFREVHRVLSAPPATVV